MCLKQKYLTYKILEDKKYYSFFSRFFRTSFFCDALQEEHIGQALDTVVNFPLEPHLVQQSGKILHEK